MVQNNEKKVMKCFVCGGKKKVLGNGCIRRECPECKGVGYVNQESMDKMLDDRKAKKAKEDTKVTVGAKMKGKKPFTTEDNVVVNARNSQL